MNINSKESLDLGESSLDESLEFGDEDELLSSSGGGGGVLVIEDGTEDGSVIKKGLVSLELVGGGLGLSGLDGNTTIEVIDLILKVLLVLVKSGDVILNSGLLVVEGGH
jgi:hypothetical protein